LRRRFKHIYAPFDCQQKKSGACAPLFLRDLRRHTLNNTGSPATKIKIKIFKSVCDKHFSFPLIA
jgi:hypothetical protein